MARITPPAVRLLRSDPFAPLVQRARELRRDHPDRHARPASSPSGSSRPAPRGSAPTRPQDALAICLDTHGRVDLDEIARLLGVTSRRRRARSSASSSTTTRPSGGWCPRPSTCPANVRAKLDHARHAATERPELEVNVARAGAGAAGRSDRRGDRAAARRGVDRRRHPPAVPRGDPRRPERPGRASRRRDLGGQGPQLDACKATSEWGTEPDARAGSSPRPCSSSARSRSPTRSTTASAARRQPDRDRRRPGEGAGAAGALRRVVLGGPRPRPPARRRVQPPVQRIVLRDYSTEGERLTLPGLARTFTPRPHQRAAVARMLAEPAVGLFHQVGAGKTAEMVIGAMELRRLGLVRKARRRGPQPHARAVLPRVAAALPAGASAGRLQRGPRRREAPRVRRPHRRQRLGRGDHDPLRVRAPPRLARRPRIAYTRRELDAAAGDARALQGRRRADRQTAGEADRSRERGTPPGAASTAPRDPGLDVRADRDRLPDRRRGPRLQEPPDRLEHPRRRDRRLPARQRSAHEARMAPRPPRRPGRRRSPPPPRSRTASPRRT